MLMGNDHHTANFTPPDIAENSRLKYDLWLGDFAVLNRVCVLHSMVNEGRKVPRDKGTSEPRFSCRQAGRQDNTSLIN